MADLFAVIPELPEPDWAAVMRMPIAECGQPLQALGTSQGFLVWPAYHRLGIPNALPECHARSEVFDRLLHAARLLPDGIRLVVLDAWRPFAVQQHLYDTLYDILKHHEPDADPAELARRTREFVAPPSTRANAPSPHLTGGAVDVTLCDRDGRWLNMGSLFDEATPRSYTRHYEEIALPDRQQRRARVHRRLLYNAMCAAGFSNLSSEWWHYDYGDQLWAWHQGQKRAIYGPAQVLPLEQLWRQQLENHRQ